MKWLDRERMRVQALVARRGISYTFKRYTKDSHGELTSSIALEYTVSGVFHIATTYVSEKVQEGTTGHLRPQPMILISIENPMPQLDDRVTIEYKTYRVVRASDIGGGGFAYDVSLELVLV